MTKKDYHGMEEAFQRACRLDFGTFRVNDQPLGCVNYGIAVGPSDAELLKPLLSLEADTHYRLGNLVSGCNQTRYVEKVIRTSEMVFIDFGNHDNAYDWIRVVTRIFNNPDSEEHICKYYDDDIPNTWCDESDPEYDMFMKDDALLFTYGLDDDEDEEE